MTDSRAAVFAEEALGQQLVPPYAVIGVERDGHLEAAMVFNHWTGADVHVSVAARKGRLHRSLIRSAGRYAFQQLGCCRATLITESRKVFEYGLRLGAVDEGLCRNQFGIGRDGFRLAFHRDEWRF